MMNWNEATDDQINRAVHERIMGKCWHELGPKVFDPYDKSRTGRVCPHCQRYFRDEQLPNNPNYCSDESSRSLIISACHKVLETVDSTKPDMAICETIRDKKDRVISTSEGACISARYIAIACLTALEIEP
jgi:methionyl-tRNA synthetase